MIRSLLSGGRRSRRRVWVRDGRAHIEVRGIERPENADLAAGLEAALSAAAGVEWARVNALTGRVVVSFDAGITGPDELLDVVEKAEAEHGTALDSFPNERPDHPADPEPLAREGAALIADAAALGVAVVGRLARLARLPVEVASLASVVQSQPRLRDAMEHRLGAAPTNLSLAALNAIGNALAQGPLGLVADATVRGSLVLEHLARRRLWETAEPELCGPETAGAPAVGSEPRPVGLPAGPVEQYADRATAAGVAGLGVTALLTGNARRGMAAFLATTPKAALHGREVFAAHLGSALARRRILCLDVAVLRRLDRVDCLVLDDGITGTAVGDTVVVPIDGLLPEVAAVIDVARRAGWQVVVQDGHPLVETVRSLQGDGRTVALVSSDAAALAAADCGVGVRVDGRVPWSADLVCERGLVDACFLVEAAAVAHEVSRQSAAIALAGSSVGALLGFSVPAPMAASRAMAVINVAALLAQANGVRAAVSLGRRPVDARSLGPDWHAMSSNEALERVDSSPDGLSAGEASSRRRPEADEELSLPAALLEELANPLTPVLTAAAALSSVVGSAADALIVGAVTVVNAGLGGAQRWRVERAVRAMEQASGQYVRVRRDGAVETLSAEVIVPGDVVYLEAGDSVPADCRIIVAEGLEVDESSLTGESMPVAKSAAPTTSRLVAERSSMLYDGTTIAAGRAEAVVVAVGADTEAGGAASSAQREAPHTGGVEARLRGLVAKSLPASAAAGGVVAVAGLARGVPLRETLHGGVSLAVAAVPEGLPLLATMAQVGSARRLAERGVLVRNPRAIEALGRVDLLCADKTGTLTQGRIRLHRVSDGRQETTLDAPLGEHHAYVLAVALRASPEERDDDDPLPHLTDRAVLEGASRAGVSAANGGHPWERRAELPFEPARGYHAVLGRNGDGFLLSVKGAPEVVLPRCGDWNDGTSTHVIDGALRETFAAHVDRLARRGYRILAVAQRRATGKRDLDDDRVDRLTFLGFLALADPVRPSAAEAVARLRAAGVRTVMMTGDHPSTAEGIAHELGILQAGRVLTGPEIDDLADDALAAVLPYVTVFARVTPAQKLRLVGAYQAIGHAVAMTGDGANDAPAIRLADVGVALGEHSTSGARRAADVVVPDGRIEALLDAVVEGRAMWTSVREAVAILLGGNLGETAFTVVGAVLTGRPPLNPRQLLLVNLLTDALPAMAIAGRAPRDLSPEALLAEGPDASLGRSLDRAIVARAVTTSGGAALAWTGARLTGRSRRAGTVSLAALVGTQLGQTLVTGGRDPVVALAAVGSAAVLVGVVQTPGVSQVFGCTPLGPVGWGIAGTASGIALAASAFAPSVGRGLGAVFERVAPTPSSSETPNVPKLVGVAGSVADEAR